MSSPLIHDLALGVDFALDPPLLADLGARELPPVGGSRHSRPQQLRNQLRVKPLSEKLRISYY